MSEAAVLKVVLEKLISLIQDEFVLITDVGKEMEKLSSTLTTIQAVLEDAEMKQHKSRAIQDWIVKLNDLIIEIDDILDEYTTQISKLKQKNSKFGRYKPNQILFRHKIGTRINEVLEKLDVVAAERIKYHLCETPSLERPIELAAAARETGSIPNESPHIYGREEDGEKIVDTLVNRVRDNVEISILSIVGVGGLGKTTVAQLVYNDQRVVDHFNKRIWCSVSDNFDVKTLLKAMIESGSRSATHMVHLDALQRCLWEMLDNKRYLLVLDDVWNEDQEKWYELKKVVACGSKGSSIIVTTRLKKVADIMRTLPSHYLTGLSEEQCWMLMRERAFGEEKEEYPNLEAIGKQIVENCAGVPLAAKALGGLLRFKREEKDWIYVKESEIWELSPEETLILPALRLSYHHLPLVLRQCFVYCAIFPKDSRIEKEELIFMWMAHGYISSRGALEVEDVGNDICNELVLRSLLQYVPNRVTNKLNLIMHDLVHDLALSIIENKILGTQVPRTNVRSASYSKIRQVNLRKKFVAFPKSNQSEMDISFILNNFLRLRILDASKIGINELSSALGSLKHLRNLNLSGTEIRSLPDSICGLWNLQVLNLNGCEKLEVLPKEMRYLINIRHLFLEKCFSLREMPSRIGELTSLRTLSLFVLGGGDRGNGLEELQCLKLGGKLEIRHLERVENPMYAKKTNLAEKKNFRDLRLYWFPKSLEESIGIDEKVLEALEPPPNIEILYIMGFRGRCFPVWTSNSTIDRLVKINISYCGNCLRLPQLGKLRHLKTLTLRYMARLEYIIEEEEVVQSGNPLISEVQFPSLNRLNLKFLPNIKGLIEKRVMIRSAEAFPNLENLDIIDCFSLMLPPFSTSFKKLKILHCGNLLLASLSKVDLENLTELNVKFEENNVDTCIITVETLQSLTNLKTLAIYIADTDVLSLLPEQGLQHLTALEELYIINCRGQVELPEGIKHLHCLKVVWLCNLPKMVCVPKALQHLSSSLQSLQLNNLTQLSSLPEWLGDLTSLKHLSIRDCPKIASLPASIRGMTNLRFLTVMKCPELERRCQREKGEEWHKISHIPYLRIGER